MQLEQWCEDGNKLVAATVVDLTSSINDLVHFMEMHDSLNIEEIWTSDVTYVHVITPSLQVGKHLCSLCTTVHVTIRYDTEIALKN